MNRNAKPWDGREPVTDALDRFGYCDAFSMFLGIRDRASAVKLLNAAGVDDATAQRLIDLAFQGLKVREN